METKFSTEEFCRPDDCSNFPQKSVLALYISKIFFFFSIAHMLPLLSMVEDVFIVTQLRVDKLLAGGSQKAKA